MTAVRSFTFISPIIFAFVVIVLGFITPGYDHLNYTISRLAIEKYGWIQSINFLQLALGIHLTGIQVTKILENQKTEDAIIRIIFRICSVFLVIAAFVPTDPIENVPLDYTLLTPTGLVHISLVILFLIFSPLGIVRLARIFRKEKILKSLAPFTVAAGFTALIGSVLWFAFYFLGIYLEYRGIFQKAIAVPVLLWLILLNNTVLQKPRTIQ
ncbi:DUF998 domain-containing protein [Candidatus Gottesmanbacteria bacterium]|nr:DUF998 domain-containing protein [Candidatus Gottesmanbacteria bacterium]